MPAHQKGIALYCDSMMFAGWLSGRLWSCRLNLPMGTSSYAWTYSMSAWKWEERQWHWIHRWCSVDTGPAPVHNSHKRASFWNEADMMHTLPPNTFVSIKPCASKAGCQMYRSSLSGHTCLDEDAAQAKWGSHYVNKINDTWHWVLKMYWLDIPTIAITVGEIKPAG